MPCNLMSRLGKAISRAQQERDRLEIEAIDTLLRPRKKRRPRKRLTKRRRPVGKF